VDEPCGAGVWREDSGLTNEELALADVLTGVPMVADYPSLNLGQSVMVYCYQLALMQQTPQFRQRQMKISCRRYVCVRSICFAPGRGRRQTGRLAAAANWAAEQRDTAMLHRLLHDIEKTCQSKILSYFYYGYICSWAAFANRMNCQHVAHYPAEMGQIKNSLT
jgi:tRNA/rRNA methyltransferase